MLNGDGIPAANEMFRYDNDANKNLFGHLTRDLGEQIAYSPLGGPLGVSKADPIGQIGVPEPAPDALAEIERPGPLAWARGVAAREDLRVGREPAVAARRCERDDLGGDRALGGP